MKKFSIFNGCGKDTTIGFDMDGTLYDEFDFVSQAYKNIAEIMECGSGVHWQSFYDRLCIEWLERGTSGRNLFQDVYFMCAGKKMGKEMLGECITQYRCGDFELTLPVRTVAVLDWLKKNRYGLFLVTDGAAGLQKKKFEIMGLDRWFASENTVFTSEYGADGEKPGICTLKSIKILQEFPGRQVFYVGDRKIDMQFAENAGFSFIRAHVLNFLEEM